MLPTWPTSTRMQPNNLTLMREELVIPADLVAMSLVPLSTPLTWVGLVWRTMEVLVLLTGPFQRSPPGLSLWTSKSLARSLHPLLAMVAPRASSTTRTLMIKTRSMKWTSLSASTALTMSANVSVPSSIVALPTFSKWKGGKTFSSHRHLSKQQLCSMEPETSDRPFVTWLKSRDSSSRNVESSLCALTSTCVMCIRCSRSWMQASVESIAMTYIRPWFTTCSWQSPEMKSSLSSTSSIRMETACSTIQRYVTASFPENKSTPSS